MSGVVVEDFASEICGVLKFIVVSL